MQKTIIIPPHLTACQFGITDVDYFIKNIRGKQVSVVNETKGFLTIADAHSEEWTVNKGDLQSKPEKEVA